MLRGEGRERAYRGTVDARALNELERQRARRSDRHARDFRREVMAPADAEVVASMPGQRGEELVRADEIRSDAGSGEERSNGRVVAGSHGEVASDQRHPHALELRQVELRAPGQRMLA